MQTNKVLGITYQRIVIKPFENISPKYKGMLFMLFASFAFSVMSLFVRLASENIPTVELVFFRNLIGLVFILPSFLIVKIEQKINKEQLPLLIFRGVMGTLALSIIFYNFKHIPLGLTATYVQTSPLFIAVLSFFLLKENLKKSSWLAIVIGFIGILFIFNPDVVVPFKYHLLGLISGIGTSIAYTSVRRLNTYYETRLIILSFLFCGTLLPLAVMLWGYFKGASADGIFLSTFIIPQGIEWFYILMIGISALFGQVYMTRAYGTTKAGIVATTGYFQIFFTAIVGIAIGDPFFQFYEWIGIALIIVGGIVISFEKHE